MLNINALHPIQNGINNKNESEFRSKIASRNIGILGHMGHIRAYGAYWSIWEHISAYCVGAH